MNSFDTLYTELEHAMAMTEEEVRAAYHADSKEEIIALIREEIDFLERESNARTHFDEEDEQEEERLSICLSQGLSRYC